MMHKTPTGTLLTRETLHPRYHADSRLRLLSRIKSPGQQTTCSVWLTHIVTQCMDYHEVGRWRGTIAGPAPSASSRTTQDRFRVMWLSSGDLP